MLKLLKIDITSFPTWSKQDLFCNFFSDIGLAISDSLYGYRTKLHSNLISKKFRTPRISLKCVSSLHHSRIILVGKKAMQWTDKLWCFIHKETYFLPRRVSSTMWLNILSACLIYLIWRKSRYRVKSSLL